MAGRYEQALQILAGLRPRVDAFFDAVLVMAQDEAVRNNRLALLQEVVAAFGHVADLSLVKGRS
jgi:glycyl-tRNA synthetase beta chain